MRLVDYRPHPPPVGGGDRKVMKNGRKLPSGSPETVCRGNERKAHDVAPEGAVVRPMQEVSPLTRHGGKTAGRGYEGA